MRCQKALLTSCRRCSRPLPHSRRPLPRNVSTATGLQEEQNDEQNDEGKDEENETKSSEEQRSGDEAEQGAMSRRLGEMAEQSLQDGDKSARKNVQEARFSEELKAKLENKIAAASFKSDHAAAFSVANMPASAGKQTQDIAAASPWTGNESIHDVSLRMLDDASKPIRVPFKPPTPGPTPAPVDLKPSPKLKQSSGQRLASARERTTDYTFSQESGLSQKERESIRSELREGLAPGARTFPGTLKGLSSLANERIEDAIAQGEFRDLPRGKGKYTEREQAAENSHLDTTEYLMNRILQKQQATPEWIQKQQELRMEIERFRGQLRASWRRHASRLIASQGGSLQTQIRRAQAYAAAESRQTTAAEDRKFAESDIDKSLGRIADDEYRTQIDHEGRITQHPAGSSSSSSSSSSSATPPSTPHENDPLTSQDDSRPSPERLPAVSPLRDSQYLSTEHEYHVLKIKKLNEQIRSYNLQAPAVSQRGYLTLSRELGSCYAEVAPSLPEEVRRRATERAHDRAQPPQEDDSEKNNGLPRILGMNQTARVHDEDSSRGYGFRELWRDLWQSREY